MSQWVHYVSDSEFSAQVLEAQEPVLVDFWAEWCGPCRALSPIFEEVAAEYQGRVKFVKVNVDESPETPGRYAVRGIPTLILFKAGAPEVTKVGGLTKSQLKAFIDAQL